MAMKNFGWPQEMKDEVVRGEVAPSLGNEGKGDPKEKEVLTREARDGAVGCLVTVVGLLSLIVGVTALTDWRWTCVVVGVLFLASTLRRN